MILQAEIVLAVAYPVFAHLASRDPRFGAVALVDLILLILIAPLVRRRAWAWLALPAALFGVFALYRAGQITIPILLVPVAFVALIAYWFGRSLRVGRCAVTKIVAALDREPPERLAPDLYRYNPPPDRRLGDCWLRWLC